jgi:hypothetical protein
MNAMPYLVSTFISPLWSARPDEGAERRVHPGRLYEGVVSRGRESIAIPQAGRGLDACSFKTWAEMQFRGGHSRGGLDRRGPFRAVAENPIDDFKQQLRV